MAKVCSNCNNVNEEGDLICARCGQLLIVQPEKMSEFPVPPLVYRPVIKCAYHPTIPFMFTCARCGRPICGACAKIYWGYVLCVQCARETPYFPALPVYPLVFYAALPVSRFR